MREVIMEMQSRMMRMKTIDTGALKGSPSSRVSEIGAGGEAVLLFKEYGRYLDMGVNKYNPLGGVKQIGVALQNASDKNKGMKPRKIYSPVAYGKLNGLMGDLLYGYTEETIQALKNELENGKQNITS